MINDLKVLVVSVSAWNSKVGMNTWPVLLENFNPDNVANITIRNEQPDSRACNNYFAISESRVIKSIIKRKIKTGNVVERSETGEQSSSNNELEEHNRRYSRMKKHRSFFTLMAREAMWKLGKWKSEELKEFVTDFNPDVVLYSMDGYIHFNRLCEYVKRISKAKSIGFFVDDNFTYKQSRALGHNAFRIFQRRSLKRIAKRTDGFWAITEKTKREADKTFSINSTVITKPLNEQRDFSKYGIGDPIRILYTGNLEIGREKSLAALCESIEKTANGKFHVDVYSKTSLSDSVTARISPDVCTMHPPVTQGRVLELQREADVLLFLEGMSGPDSKIARLSFSTKITDYLSSGRCILAIGCADTAPMEYFSTNDSAIVATSDKEIKAAVEKILTDPKIIMEYAENAHRCGIENHGKEKILGSVEKSIRDTIGK